MNNRPANRTEAIIALVVVVLFVIGLFMLMSGLGGAMSGGG